jgi:N-acetylmuramoyl-L-alanine amidase
MKSLLTACFLFALILLTPLAIPTVVHAENAISLFLDGKPLQTEVPPVLVEGNTLVPVRVIAENLGAKVGWDGSVRKVTVKDDDVSIEMTIDRPQVKVNNSDKTLEVPPKIIDGNTMLPVRFVSETMGVQVTWDGLTRSVFLYQADSVLAQGKSGDKLSTPASEIQVAVTNPVNPVKSANPEKSAIPTKPENPASPPGSVNPVKPENPSSPPVSVNPVTVNQSAPGSNTISTNPVHSTSSATPVKQLEQPIASTTPTAGSSNLNPSASSPKNSTVASSGTAGIALESTVNITLPATGQTGAAKPSAESDRITVNNPSIPDITAVQLVGDRIYIQATGTVGAAKLTVLSNPNRLAIDIPGSELGLTMNGQPAYQNGEIFVSSKFTDKIRYSLFSDKPSTVRIVLDLKEKAQASPVLTNFPNQAVFLLKTNAKFKIVLDAGHGGHDSGAVSITGKYEKDFNLSMVKKVKALLEREPDVEVLTTRLDDTFVELDDRAAFANDNKADVFVSIHGNNYTATTAGVETYYARDDSIALANRIHPYIVAATGFPDRKVRQENFRVVLKTMMPAVLLEVGYLSNPAEEARMYTDAFQNQLAAAIVNALKVYLQVKP